MIIVRFYARLSANIIMTLITTDVKIYVIDTDGMMKKQNDICVGLHAQIITFWLIS